MPLDVTAATASLPTTTMIQRADEARAYSFTPTDRMRFMFGDIDGAPDFFDESGARGDSAPLHRHPWATWEYVLEGTIRFVIDDEEHLLSAGDFVYTPPNAVHTYVIETDTARAVGFNHPGGRFEELQRTVGPMFAAEGGPDMAAIVQRAAELGVEILGPPLEPSPTAT